SRDRRLRRAELRWAARRRLSRRHRLRWDHAYAAIQAQSFHTPSYTETGAIPNGFALTFNGRDATDTRSELGARFDRVLAAYQNAVLAFRRRAAWAHDWVSDLTLRRVDASCASPSAAILPNKPANFRLGIGGQAVVPLATRLAPARGPLFRAHL